MNVLVSLLVFLFVIGVDSADLLIDHRSAGPSVELPCEIRFCLLHTHAYTHPTNLLDGTRMLYF